MQGSLQGPQFNTVLADHLTFPRTASINLTLVGDFITSVPILCRVSVMYDVGPSQCGNSSPLFCSLLIGKHLQIHTYVCMVHTFAHTCHESSLT